MIRMRSSVNASNSMTAGMHGLADPHLPVLKGIPSHCAAVPE